MFHLLLESVLPEFDHYLEMYIFPTLSCMHFYLPNITAIMQNISEN
jgi:hypothetical protein